MDRQGLLLDIGLRSNSVQLEPEASVAGSGELGRETNVPEGKRGNGFVGKTERAEP